jgi:hypothetical protein
MLTISDIAEPFFASYVQLSGVILHKETPEYLNGATITGTVVDSEGQEISGLAFTLEYVQGSDGCYAGYLSKDLPAALSQEQEYGLRFTFPDFGRYVEWDLPRKCYCPMQHIDE